MLYCPVSASIAVGFTPLAGACPVRENLGSIADPTPCSAPPLIAPTTPCLRAFFNPSPAKREEPALAVKPVMAAAATVPAVAPKAATAAGPKKKPTARPVTSLPTVLLVKLLTALPTDLNALPTSLNKLKNSGIPVLGLIVPLPPLRRNIRASAGVMCANMVSPLRP